MDDERIERALRAEPADEPDYFAVRDGAGRERRARTRSRHEFGGLVSAMLVVAVVVIAVGILRPGTPPQPGAGKNDLLADVMARGTLRVVVTNGKPQLLVPATGYAGFDLDVAGALAEQLGVGAQIEFVDPAIVEGGTWDGRWDVALDSVSSTDRRAALLWVGDPYYRHDAAVIVAEKSAIVQLAALAGRSVCVVGGGLAERWLAGTLDLVGGQTTVPPAGARVITRVSADACAAAVQDETADAFVADWVFDLPSVPAGLRQLPDAPFVSDVAPAVDPGQPGGETLLAAVDRAVAALRADGTLRSLSERRFGGADVTATDVP